MSNLSAVEYVDFTISTAIELGASDIHLEPEKEGCGLRFRIDGILYPKDIIDSSLALRVASRIKVLANINVAEKRIPQDGKFCVNYQGHQVDLRVSTFPFIYGEKVVIRILDQEKNIFTLASLGFSPKIESQIKSLVAKSSGFFLVTGPTGSGKTTTLYSILSFLKSSEKNISTLEDPVEYTIFGIVQSQVNSDIGFTFEKGIRSILRQDPDIIMVGEMRDKETAEVAIRASLTGHLVLSTAHTNDASKCSYKIN